MRRPVLIGAGLGLLVSMLTWVLAQTLLQSLEQYGEKLEAVVGLIAIAVLLLIMNWFFHRVYWSEWIGRFHRRRRELLADEKAGFFSAQVLGLAMLGLTSVYREGFETVLFLQSLELSAGTVTVLEGAGLGLGLTLIVAVLTFALQRKLPYKKMLIATGVLLGVRARRDGRPDRAHDAGHGLAADHAGADRRARTGRGCGSACSRPGRRCSRRSARSCSSSAPTSSRRRSRSSGRSASGATARPPASPRATRSASPPASGRLARRAHDQPGGESGPGTGVPAVEQRAAARRPPRRRTRRSRRAPR